MKHDLIKTAAWEAMLFREFHVDRSLYKFSSTNCPVLGAFKLLFPESRPSKLPIAPANKPNPGSRKTYWGPSTPAKIFGIWTQPQWERENENCKLKLNLK